MSGKKHNKLKGLWATSLTWVIYIDLKWISVSLSEMFAYFYLKHWAHEDVWETIEKNQLYIIICACLKSNMTIIKCSVVILEKNIFKYFSLYMYVSMFNFPFLFGTHFRSELVTDVDNFESTPYMDIFLKISQTVTL